MSLIIGQAAEGGAASAEAAIMQPYPAQVAAQAVAQGGPTPEQLVMQARALLEQAEQARLPLNYTNQPSPPVFNFRPSPYTNTPVAPLQRQPTDPGGNMYNTSPYGELVRNAQERLRDRRRHHRGARKAARAGKLARMRAAGMLHGFGNIDILGDEDMGAGLEILGDDGILGGVSPGTKNALAAGGLLALFGAALYAVNRASQARR